MRDFTDTNLLSVFKNEFYKLNTMTRKKKIQINMCGFNTFFLKQYKNNL